MAGRPDPSDGDTLASVDTIARIVPSAEQQRQVIALLEQRAQDVVGLHERFATALAAAERLVAAVEGEEDVAAEPAHGRIDAGALGRGRLRVRQPGLRAHR